MEKQHQIISGDIDKAYAELNKHPYHLHAICVHDGNAQSGHYYTFIKDRMHNKWWRFNDYRVTEASEEDVFKESNGGHSWMTAYWVLYIDDSLAKEISTIDIYSFATASQRGDTGILNQHYYSDLIPGENRMLVSDDNKKLANDVDDWQTAQFVKGV